MKLEITNCNNIDTGNVTIEENMLNIKYAMNGTGKSTIARAIELQIKGDGSIKDLTPFKLLKSNVENQQPQITGLDRVSSVSIFNDAYINQFAFKQDEILANSFEIFVRTPDYDKYIVSIEKLIAGIKKTFNENKEIDQVIADLTTLSDSFGKSKSGYSEASVLAKGIGKGNKVANIPKGLESYTEYLKSSLNSKWLRWQMDGNTYSGLSENCPYCTSSTTDKKETISKVSKEYNVKSIEHLNKIITVVESLGKYFSADANSKLKAITHNIEGLSREELNYLLQIKGQINTLKNKMFDLRGITYFSMKDEEKVSDLFISRKIKLPLLSEMNSPSTKEIVDKINRSLDDVLSKVGLLQGEIAKQTQVIKKTIEENKSDINDFLRFSGYKYYVDVEYINETYKMRLQHIDLSEAVVSGSQHLSYGEKNAFALVLFMYECLSTNPDIVILDDPISSFDKNKKYAVVDMLFRSKKSLRNKTVLMMTHDLEPIIDILYTLPHHFEPIPHATFIELKDGVICEKQITREDLLTFGEICNDNMRNREEDVVKLVYLRRFYEIYKRKELSYQLLSNLLHKRTSPFKKEGGKEIPLTQDEIATATTEIQSKISSFDYNLLLQKVTNVEYMKDAFKKAKYNYEKLQIFRILQDGSPRDNAVIHKFINETFHIENEYIVQINPCKYEMVPAFIIEECNKLLNGAV
jgi:energy-coupling factor transporter ATP-binding protein EcfA2